MYDPRKVEKLIENVIKKHKLCPGDYGVGGIECKDLECQDCWEEALKLNKGGGR